MTGGHRSSPGDVDSDVDVDAARSPPGQWRLLAPALLGWAVTSAVIVLPGSARWVPVVAGALGVVALGLMFVRPLGAVTPERPAAGRLGRKTPRRTRIGRAAILACAVLLVLGARIDAGERLRADPGLAEAAAHHASVGAVGVLRGFPEPISDSWTEGSGAQSRSWARAELETESGGVPVLLWLDEPAALGWAPGTRLALDGSPKRLDAASSAAYAVSVHEAGERAPDGAFGSFRRALGETAVGLRQGLRTASAAVPGAELVPGLAVGDTSLVGSPLEERMTESSLTHLVAVSGANCALVTGAVVAVAARLGAGRRLRLWLAGGGLAGFALVVGPDASVQRATVMAVVVLVSRFGGKRAVALPALGAAILVLLLGDPWQALQPGFALSVAATGGILLLVPPLRRGLARIPGMPDWLALAVSVALASQLACGPLLLLLQPGIPAVGVLANVLAAPAAPIGTAAGLLALLLLPASGPFGELAVRVAALAARWIAATAEVTAALPLARWSWPGGWGGALLLASVEGAFGVAWLLATGRLGIGAARARPRGPWGRTARRPRAVRLACALLVGAASGVATGAAVVPPIAARIGVPRDWAVVACDVGQGDAILLRDPKAPASVMLVDTGDDPERLTDCLETFGVRRVSLLVLTHDDRDHVGALDAVADIADEALIAPDNLADGADRSLVRSLRRHALPYRVGTAGDTGEAGDTRGAAGDTQGAAGDTGEAGDTGGAAGPAEGAAMSAGRATGLRWEVLAPAVDAAPQDTNAASLVLRVRAGPATVLLLADTGLDEQLRLRAAQDLDALRADVLKVAHHGSRDRDPELACAVGAELALISVGAENGYGHPAAETLNDLAACGTRVLRTDRSGSIAVSGGPGAFDLRAIHE